MNKNNKLNKSVPIKSIWCGIIRLNLVLFATLIMTACGSRLINVSSPPAKSDYTGLWKFIDQAEDTHKQLRRRSQYATSNIIPIESRDGSTRRSRNPYDTPVHILTDMLIGLLSLTPKELFITQSGNKVEVDYGVAGYHSFPIAEPTKIIMANIELEAIAGWQGKELIIQLVIGDGMFILQRFNLLDSKNLLETIEVEMAGRGERLRHQRWYRLSIQ